MELESSQAGLIVSGFIYSYVIRYNDKARPVPDAAIEVPTIANGDLSKDGMTIKYRLRHNIRWQDGQTLTCDDLKFTWQVIMNPRNNVNATDGFKDIKTVDCRDPYTAVVHMKRLYAPFLQTLWAPAGFAPILPRHILEKYNDDKGSLNSAPFNAAPIGSGPFKLVEWDRNSLLKLAAFPQYFLGKPKLNEVLIKIIPDENTVETQLRTHEIDFLSGGGLNSLRFTQLVRDPENGLKLETGDTDGFLHIDFNLRRPVINDREVRLALACATNRSLIVKNVEHNFGVPAETDQSPVLSWAYTSDVEHHPYDPEKARRILTSDGWEVGSDGIREKRGRRLEFVLTTINESVNFRTIETVLQREWRDVGIQADVKNVPATMLFANDESSGILRSGNYDVAIFSWFALPDPDDNSIYTSSSIVPHGQNSLFWRNRKVDAAEHDALSTIDARRRKADYKVVQQQFAHDVPSIVLYYYRATYLYNSDLKGFSASPTGTTFWNPWNYSI
ncbi:MAG: peptide ABC transporter substrate-binding protein [Candidatus Eremiobacteraeota bacterium]|nr:peptide ABC transporter substrate-binding protein [Candidatus Eremiobacteraeota bacterium]